MRVAVTGAGGRLGRALIKALADAPFVGPSGPIAWRRPELDLDSLSSSVAAGLIERDRPEIVVHAAAWTDVDGCARDPELAMARNARATESLALACAERGVDLVVISTNEVFDGRRTDGYGYLPEERTNPINPYGASKLAGEEAAREAFHALLGSEIGTYRPAGVPRREPQLAIVRTAWLFGPPGNDFPAKILRELQVLSLINSRTLSDIPTSNRDRLTGWGETALRVSTHRRKQIKRFSVLDSQGWRESETFEWRNTRPELFFLGAKRPDEKATRGLEF